MPTAIPRRASRLWNATAIARNLAELTDSRLIGCDKTDCFSAYNITLEHKARGIGLLSITSDAIDNWSQRMFDDAVKIIQWQLPELR